MTHEGLWNHLQEGAAIRLETIRMRGCKLRHSTRDMTLGFWGSGNDGGVEGHELVLKDTNGDLGSVFQIRVVLGADGSGG